MTKHRELDVIQKEILSFGINNSTRMENFIKKNKLNDSFWFNISQICYALSLSENNRYYLQKYRQEKIKYTFRKWEETLREIRKDKVLKGWLKINNAKLDKLIALTARANKPTTKKQRVNHRKFLFESLKPLWHALNKKGIGQQKQLNIVYDLFKEYRFQDYHHENNFEEKRDRIRKTYQEPGLKQALKEYGK